MANRILRLHSGRLEAARWGFETEGIAAGVADLASPASGGSLTFGGVVTGITRFDRETCQHRETVLQADESRVVKRQQRQNVLEQMRPGHGQAGFLSRALRYFSADCWQ